MEKINKQKVYNYYNKKSKWLGLIDYKTIVFFVIYCMAVIKVVMLFSFFSSVIKIYFIAIFVMPAIIFIVINLQEECIVNKLIIILKYYISPKVYVNKKYYASCKQIYVKNVEKYRIEKQK